MSSFSKTGSNVPNGNNYPKGKLFIDGVAVNTTAAELNSNVGIGTSAFQAFVANGTATNGAIVFTSLNYIAGFNVNGFTSANAPIAIGTAVISAKTLTITPVSGGVVTDKWYVQTWA
jgi:hypothetical protein